MTTLPRKPERQKSPKRSPLGWAIAGLLAGELDTWATMRDAAGELGERIVQAFTHVRWGELTGTVQFTEHAAHDAGEACVRIACAHALKALERTSPENRRACSSALFRGHTHTINGDGERQYVPGHQAGGLSARLGRCPRTLDRHCQVLEAAGLADVWQPPALDVPKSMRGHEYAYAVYEWRPELPRGLVETLIAWWGTAEQRAQAKRAAARARSAPAAAVAPAARPTSEHARATAERLLGRFGPGS